MNDSLIDGGKIILCLFRDRTHRTMKVLPFTYVVSKNRDFVSTFLKKLKFLSDLACSVELGEVFLYAGRVLDADVFVAVNVGNRESVACEGFELREVLLNQSRVLD